MEKSGRPAKMCLGKVFRGINSILAYVHICNASNMASLLNTLRFIYTSYVSAQ